VKRALGLTHLMSCTSVIGEFAGEEGIGSNTLAGEEGIGSNALAVKWHLCSDHKLVTLFRGFGGSGCNKPCFKFNWDRTKP
jgi:hypothetical protein